MQTERDGTETVRFHTVAARDTPAAMEELDASFDRARNGEYHPVPLVGC